MESPRFGCTEHAGKLGIISCGHCKALKMFFCILWILEGSRRNLSCIQFVVVSYDRACGFHAADSLLHTDKPCHLLQHICVFLCNVMQNVMGGSLDPMYNRSWERPGYISDAI